jgi:hypothetical protein
MPAHQIKKRAKPSLSRRKRKAPLIKKHGHMMMTLLQAPPKMRRNMTKHAPNELIHCVSECCQNVLKGNVPLSPAQMRKLKPKRQVLRALADKKVPIQKKKKIINQKGGFLPLLALAAAPVVTSLAREVLRL